MIYYHIINTQFRCICCRINRFVCVRRCEATQSTCEAWLKMFQQTGRVGWCKGEDVGRNKPTTAWGVVLWLNMSILISCCCFFLVGLLLNSVYLYIYMHSCFNTHIGKFELLYSPLFTKRWQGYQLRQKRWTLSFQQRAPLNEKLSKYQQAENSVFIFLVKVRSCGKSDGIFFVECFNGYPLTNKQIWPPKIFVKGKVRKVIA